MVHDNERSEILLLLGEMRGMLNSVVSMQITHGERIKDVEARASKNATDIVEMRVTNTTNRGWIVGIASVIATAASLVFSYIKGP